MSAKKPGKTMPKVAKKTVRDLEPSRAQGAKVRGGRLSATDGTMSGGTTTTGDNTIQM